MKIVISASRRTDLPRWYLKPTLEAFTHRSITVLSQEGAPTYTVDLSPENIHCIVWWSKDYSLWIQQAEKFEEYRHYFQFTLLGYRNQHLQHLIEPGITSTLDQRLDQMRFLAETYSSQSVNWRFDPILAVKDMGILYNNIDDLEYIASKLHDIGITRCTISFMDHYPKMIARTTEKYNGDVVFPPKSISTEIRCAHTIGKTLKQYGIITYACAHQLLVDNETVFPSACIDGNVLGDLFADNDVSTAKDVRQREQCGCTFSTDIGSYNQKCFHNCLYCYSNPSK